jgi:hypothetical protein
MLHQSTGFPHGWDLVGICRVEVYDRSRRWLAIAVCFLNALPPERQALSFEQE